MSELDAKAELLRYNVIIDEIMDGMPESWDGEDAAGAIVLAYIREIEQRLLALGGSLERCPEDADGAPLPDASEQSTEFASAVKGGEVADRRQRAREAVHDALAGDIFPSDVERAMSAADIAIETATRVRIDDHVLAAAQGEWPEMTPTRWLQSALERAFVAAGFEVVK